MSDPTEGSFRVQPAPAGWGGPGEILETLPDAVWVLDAPTLRVAYTNHGLWTMLGYSSEQLVGSPLATIAPELSDHDFRRLTGDLAGLPGGSALHRTRLRAWDGARVPVEVRTHALLGGPECCQPHAYVNVARDVRVQAEADGRQRRAEIDAALRDDRDRIARDLHDSVIQRIFASAISVHTLRSRTGGADLDAQVAHIVDELDRSIVEIRNLIYRITPDETEGGLPAEMHSVVDDEHAALGFAPTVCFTGDLGSITGEWRHHILAMLRELLSNVAQHAGAGRASTSWSTWATGSCCAWETTASASIRPVTVMDEASAT